MKKYYTRACNFYYGVNANLLIKKKLALPLCGNKNIAFDKVEIFTRNNDKVLSKTVGIKEIKNLSILCKKKVNQDLRKIILKRKNVIGFKEKPQVTEGWINGGFFIAKKEFLNLIKSDKTILEKDPLEHVVKNKNLSAYTHSGFWKCMDTKRDKDELEKIYKKNKFNWKI